MSEERHDPSPRDADSQTPTPAAEPAQGSPPEEAPAPAPEAEGDPDSEAPALAAEPAQGSPPEEARAPAPEAKGDPDPEPPAGADLGDEANAPTEAEAPPLADPSLDTDPAAAAEASGEAEQAPPLPRWKRWGRKLLRFGVFLVVLGLVARVLFPVLFPSLLRFGGHQLDLEIGYDELNLSLSTGEVELRGLTVEQTSGGRLVHLRHLRVDLATSRLLQGEVDVERLDLDGLRIWVRRTPRGTLNWLEALDPLLAQDPEAPATPAPEPSDPPAGEAAAPGPLLPDLSFFRLRGLRVEGVEIVLRDETLAPPLESIVGLSVSLGQLHAAPDAPATPFLAEARAPGLLTLARAEGELRASQGGVSLTLRSKLEGLQFEPLRELLSEFGITPQARALAGRARLTASLAPLPAEPRVLSVDVQVEDVALFADEGEVLGLDHFSLRVPRLAPTPEAFELDVEQFLLHGARARAGRDSGGALRVAGLQVALPPAIATFPRAPKPGPTTPGPTRTAPEPKSEPKSEPEPPVAATPSASTPPAPPAPTSAPPFQIVRLALRQLSVSECSLSFADELASSQPLTLSLDSLSVSDLVWGEATTTPASLRLHASAPGILGTIAVVGSASAPSRRSFSGGLRLRGEDLCPRRLDPYLNALGIEREYEQGTLALQAALEIQAPPARTLEGSLILSDVSYRAGEVEWLGLTKLALEGLAFDLAGPSLSVGSLRIRAPRARLWRDQGGFGSCGFAFRPPPRRASPQSPAAQPPAAQRPEPRPPSGEEPPPALAPTGSAPLRGKLRLGQLSLEGAQVRFVDRALERTHAIEDLGCSLADLELDLDPAAPVTSRTLHGWLVAPGLVERAELALELRPSAQTPALRGTLSAKGLSLEPLNAYLLALGVEGLLREGICEATFGARANLGRLAEGRLEGGLELERLVLSEGPRELLSLAGASLSGLEVSPERVRLGRIALESFATRIEREPEGTLLIPGLRVGLAAVTSARAAKVAGAGAGEAAPEAPLPGSSSTETPSPRETGPTTSPLPIPRTHPLAGLSLPRFEVGALHLGQVAIDLRDAASDLDLPLRVSAAGGPLSFDTSAPTPPGPLRARIRAPGLFSELELRGDLSLSRDRLRLEGHLDLRALDLDVLRDHLQRAGLELAFAKGGGTFTSEFGAQVDLGPGRVGLSAWAAKTSLRDAKREWLGLDRAALQLGLTPSQVTLGPNVLRGPRLLIRRLPGALELAGTRLLLSPRDEPASSAPAQPAHPAPGPAPGPKTQASPPSSSEIPRPTQLPQVVAERVHAALAKLHLPRLALAPVTLEGAQVTLEDLTLTPPETISLESEGSVGPATLSPELELEPLPYRLALRLPRVLKGLELKGQLHGDPRAGYRVAGDLDLNGLRAGPLAQLLPPELGVELRDASLDAHFEAGLGLHAERGLRAEGSLTKVALRDGERSLLRLSEASCHLRQLAPSTRRVDVESLMFKGLELDLKLDQDQALHVLGLRLGPSASPPSELAPEETAPERPPNASLAPTPPKPDPAAESRARRALARASQALARRIQAELPEFSLDRLEVDLRRISLERPGAARVSVNDLRLRNTAPLLAPAGDLANAPAWVLRTEVGIAPLVSEAVVVARLRPFALEPGFEVDWALKGIQGAGVLSALPELEGTVLTGPTNATTKGALRAELVTKRREPLNFHFAQTGFGARIELSGVEFREVDSPDEAPLAGLERLSVDVRELHPERGLFVSEVEVVRPRGRFRRDAAGLHALGFTIPIPAPPAEEAPEPKEGAEPAPAQEGAPPRAAPAPASPAPPAFEIRIDRVSVSKIDVALLDESYDPPIRLPFSDLEVNLTGLTSKLLHEKGQLALECEVLGGPIPLPGSELPVPAWRRISLDLRAALFPKPTAALELEVSGVQVSNYAGLAKSFGAEIEGGRVDVEASIRLSDDARLHLTSTTTLHDLTLSEGEEGPFRSWLGLPFPVGPALETAKVINGKTLRIPVNPSPLDLTDLSLSGLLSYAALQIPRLFGEAFATILSDAVLAAPKRLVGGLTDLGQGIGNLTGLTNAEGSREVAGIEFLPGVETLSPRGLSEILVVRERLLATSGRVQLEHALGKADLARIRKLTTPPAHDRLALARRCEERVTELRRELLIVGAEASEHQAAGSERAFQATQGRFKSIALRLARAERTLDEAYVLVDESQGAPRRVSATSVALGQLRLDAIRRALVGDTPELAARVTLRRVRHEAEPEFEAGLVKFSWKE